MKYLCLVHMEPEAVAGMGPAERHDLDVRSMGYDDTLAAAGHLITAQALQGAETAVLVKVRDGRLSTTDGPYAETKEQLGGFLLIEARDLNEAIRLAAGIPLAELATIEVRPIYEVPVARKVPERTSR